MYNPYILIPFATWAIAQTIKFCIVAMKGRIDFKYLYASGGMPSVHSAVVCSLAVTALLREGLASPLFGITAIFAAIVMYDSFGVRRASGEHAEALNMILEGLREKVRLDRPELRLREILGHRPSEVIVGALIGITLAGLFNLAYLGSLLAFLSARPGQTEFWLLLGATAALLAGGVITRVVAAKRYPKSAAMRRFAKDIFTKTQVLGWLGVALVFSQYQALPVLSVRAWPILLLGGLISWDIWLYGRYRRSLPEALATEADERRKRKWLPAPKKKKK